MSSSVAEGEACYSTDMKMNGCQFTFEIDEKLGSEYLGSVSVGPETCGPVEYEAPALSVCGFRIPANSFDLDVSYTEALPEPNLIFADMQGSFDRYYGPGASGHPWCVENEGKYAGSPSWSGEWRIEGLNEEVVISEVK